MSPENIHVGGAATRPRTIHAAPRGGAATYPRAPPRHVLGISTRHPAAGPRHILGRSTRHPGPRRLETRRYEAGGSMSAGAAAAFGEGGEGLMGPPAPMLAKPSLGDRGVSSLYVGGPAGDGSGAPAENFPPLAPYEETAASRAAEVFEGRAGIDLFATCLREGATLRCLREGATLRCLRAVTLRCLRAVISAVSAEYPRTIRVAAAASPRLLSMVSPRLLSTTLRRRRDSVSSIYPRD